MATLKLVDTGPSEEQAEREWRSGWTGIAEACELALSTLHPLHPRRGALMSATRAAREAAGLPRRPDIRPATSPFTRS